LTGDEGNGLVHGGSPSAISSKLMRCDLGAAMRPS
jgi:hypothetical protein